eukprot:XP_025012338.1 transcription factor TCP5 isoform X1 [Ricinus communis]
MVADAPYLYSFHPSQYDAVLQLNNEKDKMITSSREKGFQAKQEGDANDNNKKFSKAPSTSRQWSAFRNPRIVRVSRSFGGKDRHSKVCTIRGLRDRRIRLSVPTAIQLYDLQDRLGLSQPSKVIDWLLDATKDDIDKLPPLQLPQGFGQFHQQMLVSHESNSSQSSLAPFFDVNSTFNKDIGFHSLGIKVNNSNLDGDHQNSIIMGKTKYWEAEAETSMRATSSSTSEKGKWVRTNDHEENQDGVLSAQKLFPLASTHSSFPGLLNNPIPFNSHYHWDASNLSLSQFGTNHGMIIPQPENSALDSNTSTVALPAFSSGSQFFLCPPATVSSLFPQYPPYVATPLENNEPRETNHFQWLTSSSANNPMKNFSLGVNPGLVHHHSQRNSASQPDKDNAADT